MTVPKKAEIADHLHCLNGTATYLVKLFSSTTSAFQVFSVCHSYHHQWTLNVGLSLVTRRENSEEAEPLHGTGDYDGPAPG
jgi:hypothetical protein